MKICGVDYEIIETDDIFNSDGGHFAQINYMDGKIYLNKNMCDSAKIEALTHEVTHALLVYIGRQDLSNDESFVQALGNAINQTFLPRQYEWNGYEITCEMKKIK